MSATDTRPWEDLRTTGLLWLINAAVLHPRGFALAVVLDGDGKLTGWRLLGDGTEPWRFADEIDVPFADVEAFLNEHRPPPQLIHIDHGLTEAEAEDIRQEWQEWNAAQMPHAPAQATAERLDRPHPDVAEDANTEAVETISGRCGAGACPE